MLYALEAITRSTFSPARSRQSAQICEHRDPKDMDWHMFTEKQVSLVAGFVQSIDSSLVNGKAKLFVSISGENRTNMNYNNSDDNSDDAEIGQ